MKLFTVQEANDLLPLVKDDLTTIRSLYVRLALYREDAQAAANVSSKGGGMPGGSVYVKALYEIGKLTTELSDMGVQLKDHDRGLIDFPSLRDGRIVLLCWQLGEDDEIEWWHELDAGFSGRQRL